jgi:DNA end-binding protein Ku
VSKGRYVTVTADELETVDPRQARTIDIEDFVELDEIDPIYYDATYYLAPDKGAGKAYGLLLEAMRRTGKVGVARFVLRTKQSLCCVRPAASALALSTMNYADEIVSPDDLELPAKMAPAPRELEMAEQLVASLTTAFQPGRYRDEHREKVLALIERKAAGEAIEAPAVERRGKVVNLADALAQSLAAAKRHAPSAPANDADARAPHRQAAHVAKRQEPPKSAANDADERRAPRRDAAHTTPKRRKKKGA